MQVRLERIAPSGEAVGRTPEGMVIFVPFALPGEQIAVEVVHRRRSFARGRIIALLTPSPERVQPQCPHFGVCGGCEWQHIAYAAQVRYKTAIVREQLERIGKLRQPLVRQCIPCPLPYGYRNRIQLVADVDGRFGYRARGTHQIVPITACPIADATINRLLEERLPQQSVARADLRAFDDGARLVAESEPVGWITVGPWRYRVSGDVFFQVNTAMAWQLVQEVMRALAVQPGDRVLELYCGVGLFTLPIASAGARVLAVEVNPRAVADAQHNLAAYGFSASCVIAADAADVLRTECARWDAVLVDPPRAGLERTAIAALLQLRARRVVYVSCEPSTLARDAHVLTSHGYRLNYAQPLDLFPQTHHVETVASFELEA